MNTANVILSVTDLTRLCKGAEKKTSSDYCDMPVNLSRILKEDWLRCYPENFDDENIFQK